MPPPVQIPPGRPGHAAAPRGAVAARAVSIAVAAALTLTAVGCGTRVGNRFAGPAAAPSPSTSSPAPAPTSTSTTIDAVAATAQITAGWERFFDHTTPLADREALLEDGPSYAAALITRSKDPLQAQASAKVTAVVLTASDRATVTYDVLLNGTVALPGAQGEAVQQGGIWKVSAQSFCSLVTLGATSPVPGCS